MAEPIRSFKENRAGGNGRHFRHTTRPDSSSLISPEPGQEEKSDTIGLEWWRRACPIRVDFTGKSGVFRRFGQKNETLRQVPYWPWAANEAVLMLQEFSGARSLVQQNARCPQPSQKSLLNSYDFFRGCGLGCFDVMILSKNCTGGVTRPTAPEHRERSHHLFYLSMPTPEERDELIAYLKACDIGAVFH